MEGGNEVMSTTVDNRVVEMQFNNSQFEKGVQSSISSLDKFKESLNMQNAEKGLSTLQATVNGLDFSTIENAVVALQNRFTMFGIIGATAIQNITNRVIDLGFAIGNKLVNQIKQGGIARYQNIAQAKFQIEGLGASWEKLYDDMDYAVSGTAYGIDEAAKVASSLVASGIEAGDGMKKALRGVSGVAAMTNSTYSEIGDIFTTIAGNGKLMSMQLNQLSFKGLNAAAILGKQLGYTEAQIREMVSKGKIDFKTFADAMDDAFGEHAKEANKTFSGALANMKAALSRIGENFARPIFEGMIKPLNALREVFNEVKKRLLLFTGQLVGGSWKNAPFGVFINDLSLKLTYLIRQFKNNNMSFFSQLASGLSIIAKIGSKLLYTKGNIFDIIIDFFNESKKTTSSSLKTYVLLIDFLTSLKKIGQSISNVFGSLVEIVKVVFSSFAKVFGLNDITEGAETFADILLRLTEAMKFTSDDASRVSPILIKIFTVVKKLITLIGVAADFISVKIAPIFSIIFEWIMKIEKKIEDLIRIIVKYVEEHKLVEKAVKKITTTFQSLSNALLFFRNIFNGTIDNLKKIKPEKIGLLTAAFILIKSLALVNNFLTGFKKVEFSIRRLLTIPDNIGRIFQGLSRFTSYLSTAIIIKEVALAVFMLAASLALLTLVKTDKLIVATKCLLSLVTVLGLFGVLITGLAKILISSRKIALYLLSLSFMFISMGVAALLLTSALAVLSNIDTQHIWENFGVLSAVLGEFLAAVIILSKLAPVISAGSFGILAFAASVYVLAKSLQEIKTIDKNEVIQKLLVLIASMIALIKLMQLINIGASIKDVASMILMLVMILVLEKTLNYIADEGLDFEKLKNNIDKFVIIIASFIVFAMIIKRLSDISLLEGWHKSILTLAISMYIMAMSMRSLAKIDPKGIQQAITAYIIIMISMIVLINTIARVTTVLKGMDRIGPLFIKMAVSILIIAAALKLVASIKDPNALSNGVTSLILVLISLFAMVGILQMISKDATKLNFLSIVSLAILVATVAVSLTLLTRIGDMNKALNAAIAIGLVLLAIAAMFSELSKANIGMGLGLLGTVYAMIFIILAIAAALTLVSSIKDDERLAASLLSIIALLATVAISVSTMMKYSKKVPASAYSALFLSIFIIAAIATSIMAVSAFSKDNESILFAMLAIVGVLTTVTLSILALSYFAKGLTRNSLIGLGVAVASVTVIAISLRHLLEGDFDWNNMKTAVTSMIEVLLGVVAALTILSVVSAITGNLGLAIAGAALTIVLLALSVAIITFANSIKIIVNSLKTLTKIDYEAIDINKLTDLAMVLVKLGLVSYVAAGGATFLGIGLLMVGTGVTLVSIGVTILSAAIVSLLTAFTKLLTKLTFIGMMGNQLSKGINLFSASVVNLIKNTATALAQGIVSFIVTLARNTQQIGNAIKLLIEMILKEIGEACLKIGELLIDGLIATLKLIEKKLPTILESLGNIIGTILVFLYNYGQKFGFLGAVITNTFLIGAIDGLIQTAPELLNRLVSLAAFLIGGFADAMMNNQDVLNNSIQSIIQMIAYTIMNVLDAMLGGALSKIDGYKGVMDEIAAKEEELAAERQRMRAEREDDAYITAKKNDETKIKDTNDKIANNTTDQTDITSKNAESNANAYTYSFGDTIGKGKYNVGNAVHELLPGAGDVDLSSANSLGWLYDKTIATGIEDNSGEIIKSINGMPSEVVQKMVESGEWQFDDTGKNLVKSINSGVEEEATEENMMTSMSKYTDFFGADGTMSGIFGEGGTDSGDQWNGGLLTSITDKNKLNEIFDATYEQGTQAKAGWDTATDTNSPSKEAEKRGTYWISGLLKSLTAGNDQLFDASSKNADTVMGVYEDTLNKVSNITLNNNSLSPTITPVVDYTNIDNLTDWVGALDNTTTFKMAADSQLSIDNANQFRLGQQIDALRADINKMANTDFSKIMDGVTIDVSADTTVDGTVLRKTASSYTIGQINKKQQGYIMATGGRF